MAHPRAATVAAFSLLTWLAAGSSAFAASGLVYVSDQYGGNVDIFSQTAPYPMVGQIQHLDQPTLLYVDKQEHLFVAQRDGWIAGYKRGQTSFFTRFVDPNSGDDYLNAMCGDGKGTVYLTTSNENDGYVAYVDVYHLGNPKPVGQISIEKGNAQNAAYAGSCAVDANGDLFVYQSDESTGGAGIAEYAYPALQSQPAYLTTPASSIAFDASGNLLGLYSPYPRGDVSPFNPSFLNVYAPPFGSTPSATVPLGPGGFYTNLDASGKHLWSVNYLYAGAVRQEVWGLQELAYPSGRTEQAATLPLPTGTWVAGFAISPALQP